MGGDRSASPAVFRYEGWALESTPRGRAAPMEGKKVSRPECTRTRRCAVGKPLATRQELFPTRRFGSASVRSPTWTLRRLSGSGFRPPRVARVRSHRSEEHTSELQSL